MTTHAKSVRTFSNRTKLNSGFACFVRKTTNSTTQFWRYEISHFFNVHERAAVFFFLNNFMVSAVNLFIWLCTTKNRLIYGIKAKEKQNIVFVVSAIEHGRSTTTSFSVAVSFIGFEFQHEKIQFTNKSFMAESEYTRGKFYYYQSIYVGLSDSCDNEYSFLR